MTPLPPYSQALKRALEHVAPRHETESVALERACGRVLAEDIIADRDLPPFHRAQMDGYALRAADVGRVQQFQVVSDIPAGAPADVQVPPGACVKIATGAPLPDDVDTVIQHEKSNRQNPVQFDLNEITRGHAVHQRASDAGAGETLIAASTHLQPHHIGIAAAVGYTHLKVVIQLRAAVISSGDEVRPVGADVQPHQIRQSNAPMLNTLLRRMGGGTVTGEHVTDQLEPVVDATANALLNNDLLITIGGISAGERDLFPKAFEQHGIETIVRGAAIQPGRPVFIGRSETGTLVVGLPGNPVSALACAHLFVRPIVRAMLGLNAALPWRSVSLAEQVQPNAKRQAFRPARLSEDGDSIIVPQWAGSGDLAHTANTDGLVALPVQERAVPAGSSLRFLSWA